MKIDKILDLFMFHEGTDADSDTQNPKVTTGSIVWGVILRTILMVLLIFFVRERFDFGEYWYMLIFAFWFLVAYPAHRQYQKFTERMETFEEETLCGQCKHFNSTAQLCSLYDEHVSRQHIPCGGQDWEPKNNF